MSVDLVFLAEWALFYPKFDVIAHGWPNDFGME